MDSLPTGFLEDEEEEFYDTLYHKTLKNLDILEVMSKRKTEKKAERECFLMSRQDKPDHVSLESQQEISRKRSLKYYEKLEALLGRQWAAVKKTQLLQNPPQRPDEPEDHQAIREAKAASLGMDTDGPVSSTASSSGSRPASRPTPLGATPKAEANFRCHRPKLVPQPGDRDEVWKERERRDKKIEKDKARKRKRAEEQAAGLFFLWKSQGSSFGVKRKWSVLWIF